MRLQYLTLALLIPSLGCHHGGTSHGDGGAGGGSGSGGDMSVSSTGGNDMAGGLASDFPSAPILDPMGNTPPNAPVLFGPPSSGTQSGGPCLLDPEPNALFPQNWMGFNFSWSPMSGQNLFEIRVHADNQANDLVIYTTNSSYTMKDKTTWAGLAAHTVDQPITVTVRGAVYANGALTSGPFLGTSATVSIAPTSAPGAIIYWSATSGVTALKGFTFGDTGVHSVMDTSNISGSACIACHSSTPDGLYVGLSWTADPSNGDPAQAALRTTDGTNLSPSFISSAAATLMQRTQELPVFSKGHWASGDHIMLSMLYTNPNYDIIWTDLEATSAAGTGTLARNGDNGFPGDATWSHDGANIAYSSGSHMSSGYQTTDGDIRVIPYNNKAGGTSTAVQGASDSNYNEYFPTWSPDDRFLAFSRLPTGVNNYTPTNAPAEVLIVPAAGAATPTRLAANDPVACAMKTSPGLTNSWPKWAPTVSTVGSRTFYWLTFSSKRLDLSTPQLYVTPVVIDNGVMKTFPALYLWNQPPGEGNHTPAWDNFAIPIS